MNAWINKNLNVLLLLIAPFVILAFVWGQIPDIVPVHWNIKGVADDFAPKMPGMLIMPLMAIFVQLILWAVPFIDPKKRTEEFASTIGVFQVIFGFLMLALFLVVLMATLGKLEDPSASVLPLILLALAFMGNFFGRIRPNYFIGIRTPWTLESEYNWKKTHRLAGKLWVFVSVALLIVYPLMGREIFVGVFIAGVTIMSLIPLAYSYWLFQNGKREEV